MISGSRNYLEAVRVRVHHLVEIKHALIRKVTPSDDTFIIKNLNTIKN